MRVADYIFKYLKDYGVTDVFLVVGGGAMHLNDALKKSGLNYYCFHHEQAAAMAAEGYAKYSNKLAVVCVTSGCGGTNTLTGVLGQWTDSVPVLYISGQVREHLTTHKNPGCRQLGDQEVDIISMVKPITKYAKMLTFQDEDVKETLGKAVTEATTGRPAPVWLDVPMDIQESEYPYWSDIIHQILRLSTNSILIAGRGVRIAGAEELLKKIKMPVVTTFNNMDMLPSQARIGTLGDNHLIKEANTIICIGTRNNIRQTGHNRELFKDKSGIVVDIDKAESKKWIGGNFCRVNVDAKEFLLWLISNNL